MEKFLHAMQIYFCEISQMYVHGFIKRFSFMLLISCHLKATKNQCMSYAHNINNYKSRGSSSFFRLI